MFHVRFLQLIIISVKISQYQNILFRPHPKWQITQQFMVGYIIEKCPVCRPVFFILFYVFNVK